MRNRRLQRQKKAKLKRNKINIDENQLKLFIVYHARIIEED